MSDDFIPFNQSTPIHGRWQERPPNQRSYRNNRNDGHRHFGGNNQSSRWSNRSQQNSSLGSDCSNSFDRTGREVRNNIEAYLHPSMLQDPWAHLQNNK